jgi:hypothetical protein
MKMKKQKNKLSIVDLFRHASTIATVIIDEHNHACNMRTRVRSFLSETFSNGDFDRPRAVGVPQIEVPDVPAKLLLHFPTLELAEIKEMSLPSPHTVSANAVVECLEQNLPFLSLSIEFVLKIGK